MLMNRRIMHRLEQWHALAPYQFGFRSGRKVVDACSRLAEDIVAAFRHKEVVQAVTLNIQSAYDTVWRDGLIRKLFGGYRDEFLHYCMDSQFLVKSGLLFGGGQLYIGSHARV